MNSWTGDTDDSDESEGEPETAEIPDFVKTFEKAVRGPGSPNDIDELQYVKHLDEVDDEELLREAWLQLDGEESNLVKNRIEELGGDVPDPESSDGDDSEEQTGDGWGGSSDDEEDTDSDEAQPSVKGGEELEGEQEEQDEEPPQTSADSDSQESDGPPEPASAVTPSQAADWERRWKMMVWGPPKLFKTHLSFTMPEPIAFIDCEGKADDIAAKFENKDIRIWQPKRMSAEPDTKFRRAKKALDEALEWLDWYWENEDKRGTIVVDSMTQMWEWAQVHHKLENYPVKAKEGKLADIELSANFGSSQESDWGIVKEYHNGEFRDRITDSPFHFCWTAMEREAFQKTFEDEDNRRFMEPKGEPDNDYKADTVIRARKDTDKGKVGDLVGSNFTDNVFVGLTKPTFPKVKAAVEAIADAEASPDSVDRSELAKEVGAEAIINSDPQLYVQ